MAFGPGRLGAGTGRLGSPSGRTGASHVNPAYLGAASTRVYMLDSTTPSTVGWNCVQAHYAHEDIVNPRIIDCNWRNNTGVGEANAGGTKTLTRSLEFPVGNRIQVSWTEAGGTTTVTLADGAQVISDAIPVTIPAGSWFWTRQYQVNSVNFLYCASASRNINTALGDAVENVSGVDKTMSGTVTNVASFMVPPQAIIAMVRNPTVGSLGTSRTAGTRDVTVDATGDTGYTRLFGKYFNYIDCSTGSDQGSSFSGAGGVKRRALINTYCSHTWIDIGPNDFLLGGKTLAQVEGYLTTLAATAAGGPTKVIIANVDADTSSTDSWATTVNQTVRPIETDRVGLNAFINGLTGYNQIVDIDSFIGTGTNNQFWKNPVDGGFVTTVDGLHENSAILVLLRDSGRFNPSLLNTNDVIAPTLSSATATQADDTGLVAALSVSASEVGTLYWVISTSSTPPSAAQVRQGKDSSGSAAAKSGNRSVTVTGAQAFNVSSVTSLVTYYAYFMEEDAQPNQSNVAASGSFLLTPVPAWVLRPDSGLIPDFDLDFANNRGFQIGQGLIDPFSVFTFARALAGFAQTSAGALTSFATGVPRATDKGWLFESAIINLNLQSRTFDNASWTKTQATIAADDTTAPDGTVSADKVTETNTSASVKSAAAFTITSGGTYQTTFHVKPSAVQWVRLLACADVGFVNGAVAWFDLTNGVVGSTGVLGTGWTPLSSRIELLANGFYKCTLVYTAGAVTTGVSAIHSTTADNVGTRTGSAVYWLWEAMTTVMASGQSVPPLPVTTTTGSVTKPGDVALINSSSSAAALAVLQGSAYTVLLEHAGGNIIGQRFFTGSADGNFLINASSSVIRSLMNAVNLNATYGSGSSAGPSKIGFAYGSGSRSLVGNGGTVTTDSGNAQGANTSYGLFNGSTGANSAYGYAKRLTLLSSKVSNAGLVTATS